MDDGVAVHTHAVRTVAYLIGQPVKEGEAVDQSHNVVRDAPPRVLGPHVLAQDAFELGEQTRDVGRLQVSVRRLEAAVTGLGGIRQHALEGLLNGEETLLDVTELLDVEVAQDPRSSPFAIWKKASCPHGTGQSTSSLVRTCQTVRAPVASRRSSMRARLGYP